MAQKFSKSQLKDVTKMRNFINNQELSIEKKAISPEKQEQLNKILLEILRSGKLKKAERLIKAGADVNTKDIDGSTVLMLAAAGGHTKSAKLFVAYGADIIAKDNHGMTAPMLAAMYGRTETASFLQNMLHLYMTLSKQEYKKFIFKLRESI